MNKLLQLATLAVLMAFVLGCSFMGPVRGDVSYYQTKHKVDEYLDDMVERISEEHPSAPIPTDEIIEENKERVLKYYIDGIEEMGYRVRRVPWSGGR